VEVVSWWLWDLLGMQQALVVLFRVRATGEYKQITSEWFYRADGLVEATRKLGGQVGASALIRSREGQKRSLAAQSI
jgi:hypothetical protein